MSSGCSRPTATTTTPIVFVTAVDPVALGFVTSLNRPGGNLTGVTTLSIELEPKLLELLQAVMPTAATIGALINRSNPNAEAPIERTAGSRAQVRAQAAHPECQQRE